MSRVSVTLQLQVDVDLASDPSATEQAIAAEGRRAARELYRSVVEVLDEEATAASGEARQRLEARWVATLFGRVRIRRYRVRTAALDDPQGGDHGGPSVARGRRQGRRSSHNPLDLMLGLTQAEASLALRQFVRELSLILPTQATADVVSRVTGEPFSRQGIRRILGMDTV